MEEYIMKYKLKKLEIQLINANPDSAFLKAYGNLKIEGLIKKLTVFHWNDI
jgi:hypothetical protein